MPFFLFFLLMLPASCNACVDDSYRSKKALFDTAQLNKSIALFQSETGRTIKTAKELVNEGYLNVIPQDRWGNDYKMNITNNEARFYSTGSDGVAGGSGCAYDFGIASSEMDETNSAQCEPACERLSIISMILFIILSIVFIVISVIKYNKKAREELEG